MPSRAGAVGHNGAVNQWKWVNQFQPQTLYMATILCYVDAVFGLLFGVVATSVLAGLITIAALARRWLRHRQREAVGLRGRRRRRGAAGRACSSRCFGIEVFTSHGDHQLPVRRRPRRPAAPPDEPRVPAHLVQVVTARIRTWRPRRPEPRVAERAAVDSARVARDVFFWVTPRGGPVNVPLRRRRVRVDPKPIASMGRADRLAMSFGKGWSLKNYENNKPW